MKQDALSYQDNSTELQGYMAYDETITAKQPLVLVVHDWSGCNAFAKQQADEIAKLGYTGFAIDMYGKDKMGESKDEKMQLMQPLMSNRELIVQRIQAALATARSLPHVDTQRIAIMGFCFGGLCALDFARTGIDIKGAISIHGLLTKAENKASKLASIC